MNHLNPYIVNFYRRMRSLTKVEEKQFPKERDILAIESIKETEEENNGQPRVPSQTTARGSVQVNVLPTREQPEWRLAKRRKVLTDNEEDPLLESRMVET